MNDQPYYEYVAGGMLDDPLSVRAVRWQTCRITGSKFIPTEGKIKVKLEGSGKIGEKYIGIAGIGIRT